MEYLKVTDIMVGDIVRYADQDKPQIATIDTLRAINEGAKVVGVEFHKEDLEKLDFKNIPNGDIWCLLTSHFDFKPKGTIFARASGDGRIATLRYFHELQQAFRVVGLKYDFKPCLQ